MLSLACGNGSSTSQWKPTPAQLAEDPLINRFQPADRYSEAVRFLIGISSEQLST